MDTELNINEVFYSIQGEGFWTGCPAVFIRLSGCNLTCSWCDTDHTLSERMTTNHLIDAVEAVAPTEKQHDYLLLIVLTGGEPTLQDIGPVADAIREWGNTGNRGGVIIALETNGTNPDVINKLVKEEQLDWVTVSPKAGLDYSYFKEELFFDELKVVLAPGVDPQAFLDMIGANALPLLYIQPCSQDYKSAVLYVKLHPRWRLSVQTQKVLGIR